MDRPIRYMDMVFIKERVQIYKVHVISKCFLISLMLTNITKFYTMETINYDNDNRNSL